MKSFSLFLTLTLLISSRILTAQCPPPGFPQPGNTCNLAPILCENLDGYCATINNNNATQNFPGCPGWQLNNDEWFAFYAGSTSITIQVTPSNCSPGGMQGLQGGIYAACGPPWVDMDLQCSCTENPFILSANNFVIGQIYYFVLDGCAGNVCDYAIDVLSGSTVGAPPADPGPVSGPPVVCQGSSGAYSIPPALGATMYNWTLTPAGIGTVTGSGPNINVNWSNTASGPAQLCVTVANACYPNMTQSCYEIDVIPKPTATLSGSGMLCAGTPGNVDLTVTFTGEGPWSFVYKLGNAAQPAIQTNDNPYILSVTQPGTYMLQSVSSVTGGCTGTVSGMVTITQTDLTPTASIIPAVCGQSNGSINLTPGGGTPPYTYLWSNGETTEDLSNIPGDVYTVTLTDSHGCSEAYTVNLPNNIVNLNVTGTVTANTTCNGGNGAINVTVTPSGTYNYMWSGGEMTEDLSNLPPGTYTLTVTSGVNCTATAEFTVNDNPNTPNLSATSVQTTCDLSNGSINLTVSGGVTPYTFLWSGGEMTEDLSNIPAGPFTVTVTGANGCTSSTEVTVNNNNPPINVTATVVANTTCNGGNGSITLNIAPPGSYMIMWSGGQSSTSLTNLEPGSYTVTVSAGGSCTTEATFTIDDNPNTPTINPTITPTSCDLSNGSINLSVSGGVPPFTYSWSNGTMTQNLVNIPAGSYDVTVTGANGCSSTANVDVPNNNPNISVNGNVLSNTTCNGNGNGSISITVSPSGAYTFMWSNMSSAQNQTNLLPGTYTVTVNGGGSCIETAEFTVDDDPIEPNLTPNVTPSTCDLNNGGISLSVSGGVAPYTYLWSNGLMTQNLANIPAGSYDVTVTGANGCTNTANIDLPNNNPPIDINGNVNASTTCIGGNGSISINVSPPGTYTYMWSTGSSAMNQSGLVPGTYTVVVNGGGSCTATAEFTVPEDPNLPDLTFTQIDPNCGLSNGSINLSVFNGVPPYTYTWSSGQMTQDINNLPADIYIVTVTGANGCSAVDGVSLNNEDIPISVDGVTSPKTSCVQNNGSVTLFLDPPNLMVTWSNGSHATTLNNLAPGTYTVTVSAGGTCTETAEFTIDDESEEPYLEIEVTPATCGFSNGSINLEAFGGIQPYTYNWSNGFKTQDLFNLAAGSYAVTVSSAVGCTATAFVDVPAEDIAIEIFGVVSDNISCTQPNGYIDIDLSPPLNNYTFNWSNGKKTEDINNLPAGTYTVTVTLGTCSAVATFDVFDLSGPPNVSASSNPAICGQSNGSITLSVSGGSSPYMYHWSTNANTANVNNLIPGTYSVTVTDFFGCTATTSATVSNNNIALNIAGTTTPNTSCSAANGMVNITVSPAGTGTYVYTWSNAGMTEDIANLPAGTYSVTVSAGVGCTAAASFTVANNTSDPVLSAAITAAICGLNNGNIDLSVSGAVTPYTFAWSNMAATEDLNNILSGIYTVTVTAGNGCTADTTLNVANNASTFSLSGTTLPLTNCISNNGSVDLTVTPAGPYTYQWSNSAVTEDISNLPDGTYTVSVTETGSCTASASFIVANGLTYPMISQVVTPELCGLSNGAVDISVSGGTMPYAFAWSGSQTGEDIDSIPAGTYTVTVTGANGCTATNSATVPDNSVNFAVSGTTVPNSSCVMNNGSVDLVLNPTTPGSGLNYTFIWSNMTTTEDLNGVVAGAYSVTVSAGGTCTSVAGFNVANTAVAPQISESISAALCGQSSGGVNISISGGASPYTFNWSTNATTEDIAGVASGSYTVTVTGANGCTAVKTFAVPENVVTPNISGIPTPNTSCVAGNGSINLSVSPANLVYTYVWSGGQSTQNIANLPPGMYTVTINGGGNCTNTATFTIDESAEAPTMADTVLAALCGQNSGAVNLTVSGGISPYTFNWSNNAKIEDLSGVASGSYTVTVTGANGCTTTGVYSVPEDVIIPSIVGTPTANTSCVVSNGAIALDVTPTTLTYTYIWSGGQNTPDLSDLAPGMYTVTVNGGGSCIATAQITVDNDIKAVGLAGQVTDILCFGDKTGAIDLTVSGGTPPFSYNWSPFVAGNPEDPANLTAGSYTVTVKDSLGCSATISFAVKQPAAALQIACSQSSNVSFPGANDGAAAVNISGGTAPYDITWTPGSTQTDQPAGVFSIKNMAEGSYDVTVTDANGCTTVCNFTISIINCETALGSMSTGLLSLCGTGCLKAGYNTLGQFLEPDDILQFVLHQGSANSIVNEIARSSQPEFCFDPALMSYGTTYYISAVAGNDDGTGNVNLAHFCTVVVAGTPIVFHDQPVAAAAQPASLSCAVSQVGLTGSSTVAGSNFAWTTAIGTLIGNPNQAAVNAGSAGTYTLVVESNGCVDSVSVEVVDLSNQPSADIVANPNGTLNCKISQIYLAGDIKGTDDANTVWLYNGNIYPGGTTLTIDAPGLYEFVIVDTVSLCSDTAAIQIDENLGYPPLFINPPAQLTCITNSVPLSGGSPIPGIQFAWATLNGTDTVIVGSGTSFSATTPGTYFLIGLDPVNQCTNSASVAVAADQVNPVASAGTPFNIACYGETAYLDGSGSSGAAGLTYQWSTSDGVLVAGSNSASPEINQPGTYTLLVTNPGNGCTDTDVVQIDPNDPIAIASVDNPDCEGEKGRIIIDTVIGGAPPLLYSIDNGQHYTTQNFFVNLNPGSYTIEVQDANGCSTSVDAVVDAPDVFQVSLDPQVILQLGDSYQINTQISVPLTEVSSIQWVPATGLSCDTCLNPVAMPFSSMLYRITVYSKNGCKDSAPILLLVDKRAHIYVPNIFSPDGDGENDVFTIYADPKSVKTIKSFQVFSRWGELVYEYYNFDPNNPVYGWDGRHRGQELNPAVFAWYAVIEFIDGREELFEGDVTLKR